MKSMVFVRTRYIGEGGKIRANLANTTLRRGGTDCKHSHSLSTAENHLAAARLWVIQHMNLVKNKPVGMQSYDNGYIYAFEAD